MAPYIMNTAAMGHEVRGGARKAFFSVEKNQKTFPSAVAALSGGTTP
jgi:hypothetical protein